jgi:hypothetical protein
MDQIRTEEFRALRTTIRSRGSFRLAICLAGLVGWALTLLIVLAWVANPIAGTVPLLLVVATFEMNRMLHLGIERIGRYLQVFFEEAAPDAASTPAWERTVMRLGPSLPGAGGHPLLVPIFFSATLINFLSVLLPGPTPIELGAMTVPHVSFLIWMLYADRGMRQQRERELEEFRKISKGLRP